MQELEFGHHTCTTWDTEHGVKRLDVKMSLRCASSIALRVLELPQPALAPDSQGCFQDIFKRVSHDRLKQDIRINTKLALKTQFSGLCPNAGVLFEKWGCTKTSFSIKFFFG